MAGSSRYTTAKNAKLYFLSGTLKTLAVEDAPDSSEAVAFAVAANFLTDIVTYEGGVVAPVTISETGWNGKIVTEPGTGTIGDVTVTAFFRKGGTDSTKTVEFAELEEGTEVQFLRELDDGAGGKSWFYQRGKVSVEADVSIADGAISKMVAVFTASSKKFSVDLA